MFKFEKLTNQDKLLVIEYFLLGLGMFVFFSSRDIKTYLYYFTFATVSFILILLSEKSCDNSASIFFYILGVFIFGFVFAFRKQIGTDDINYLRVYNYAKQTNFYTYVNKNPVIGTLEKGYLVVNYLFCKVLNFNYNSFQIFIAYFSFIFWAIAIWKYSNMCSRTLGFIIIWTNYYFLIMGAGLQRIFIAIPFAFLALYYLSNQNYIKFFLFVFIGYLFHSTILFIIILFPLYKSQFIKNNKYIYILVMLLLLPISLRFIQRLFGGLLSIRFSQYILNGSFSFNIADYDMLPIALIGSYFYQYINDENKEMYLCGVMCCYLSVILSVFSFIVSVNRLMYYANIGTIITISAIPKIKYKHKLDCYVIYLLMIYLFLYLYRSGFNSTFNYKNIFPYMSIIDGVH